jgi:Domain of unknown function DUF29
MSTIDQDFHAWTLEQAAALKARDYESLDWDHLAEEVALLGAQERRALRSHLTNLLLHLLKLKFQPGEVYRHNSWRSSARAARDQLADVLEESPGIFGGKRDEVLALVYERARRQAADQSGLPLSTFPEECPWTYEQIMDENFFPCATKTGTTD